MTEMPTNRYFLDQIWSDGADLSLSLKALTAFAVFCRSFVICRFFFAGNESNFGPISNKKIIRPSAPLTASC
jgi:hypothetical protein